MNNFIQRKFQNINTDEIIDFDRLTKIHMQMPFGGVGFEKQHISTIAIILGEPASGKTYQLEEYNNQNKDTSLFVELVNLDDSLLITQNIDIVLIDSIDEALTDFNNPKKLQKKLVDFIERCNKVVNNRVRFVITCRFLEWSNIFESSLKEIDKELRIYNILQLSQDDINDLLKQKNINQNDFWEFIEGNYLESLLKNILVILSIIDRFDEYKTKRVTFVDIYHHIAKEYLSKKGEDREEIVIDISINKLLKIASSLATYMTFNRKLSVDSTNLSVLASELYKIDGQDIVVNDLKVILNTALFEKKGNEFSFFHQTIQEYLTAYFLADKDFDSKTLKNLLASDMRFYEEFEEIVVYLTNIQQGLFNDFVKFDPFIFKRHPSLTEEQQERLLNSLLDKFYNEEVQAWGRWESLDGTTLVCFDKIVNIVSILKNYYNSENTNYYLMQLLKYNYSEEFKSFMLDVFRQKLSNKKSLKDLIRGNFFKNYDFNIELYNFMKKNDLFVKDEHVLFMSFEAELFCSLYGIKYKYQHGSSKRVVDRTSLAFQELLVLLNYIPTKMLEYIAPYLIKEDAKKWFEHLKETYNRQVYNDEYVSWVLYAVLTHYSSKVDLEELVTFIKENPIFLHSWDKEEIKLDFQKISKDFWELYFESGLFDGMGSQYNIVFASYDIKLKDIIEVVKQYPIKDNLEKYVQFKLIENADDFLMQNDDLKKYMEHILEQQRQRDEEFRKQYPESADREYREEEFLKECIEKFGTDDEKESDLYDIFLLAFDKYHGVDELNKFLKENLLEKYPLFIHNLKNKFEVDTTYNKLKKELISTSLSNTHSFMFEYLFAISDDKKINNLIKTKKDYIKLFWHSYRFSLNTMDEYFIELSGKYFDCFKLLTLHTLKLSLQYSEYTRVGSIHLLFDVFKNLDKFNYENLKEVIKYIKDNNILVIMEDTYEKENILKVLSLDNRTFSYILELIKQNKLKIDEYLYFLLQLDRQRIMKYFFKIYDNTRRKKSLYIRLKNKIFEKVEVVNKYDKFEINPEKIELYKILISSMKKSNTNFENIDSNYIYVILTDYYDFFETYRTPKGVYRPDIYDAMYRFINKRWEELENNSKYIEVLNRLKDSKNARLSDRARYALTKVYEMQEKERSYPNSHYKGIFDMENKKGDRDIENSEVITQNKSADTANESEQWYQKWWFFSTIAGGIAFCGILWSFDSLIFAAIGSVVSFFIVWKLNPKFRFRNIGYALLGSGLLSNLISFSGIITIPKNDIIHGVIKLGDNHYSWWLILLSIPFFILDYLENKR